MTRSERQARTWAIAVVLALCGALVATGGAPAPAAAYTSPPQYLYTFGTANLSAAQGVAVSPVNSAIYVVDSAQNRVVRFDAGGNFVGQWGSAGSGNGQFNQPYGVAVAADGTVYVADTFNNRVQLFTADGTYQGQWGTNGALNGQMTHPYGVAVDPSGNVYVADTGNHRVQKFSSTGTYKTKWGTRGTAAGRFVSPQGIAVTRDGKVYVLDNGNNRVQQFTGTGTYQRLWGTGGTGDGQLSTVGTATGSLAVDGAGNVWVADGGNHRVQEFSGTGAFLTSFGGPGATEGRFEGAFGVATTTINGSTDVLVTDGRWRAQWFTTSVATPAVPPTYLGQWGTQGSGNGQFNEPWAVEVGPDGTVFVADAPNNRIERFNSAGGYLGEWGSSGTGNGQFSYPVDIAVGPMNVVTGQYSVYVADSNNFRVQRFTKTGGYLSQAILSPIGGPGLGRRPTAVTVAPDGDVYFADIACEIYSASSDLWSVSPSGTHCGGSGAGELHGINALASDLAGNLYVGDAVNDRVVRFDGSVRFLDQWGTAGTGNGQFGVISGLALQASGNVLVADDGLNRIQELTPNGRYLTQWGASGAGNGQFNGLSDLAVSPGGDVYVADALNHRIQRFGLGESPPVFVNAWGSSGSGDGQFGYPYQVATDAAGNVYVTDFGNNRVEKFSSTGTYLAQWSGSMSGPVGVAVGPDSSVYVVDYNTARIERSSATGTPISQWGSPGAGNGQFSGPFTVAVAPDGTVYVTDPGNNRVQYFTAAGAYLGQWGGTGSGNGQFDAPLGVAVGPDGSVYVTDEHNNRVQKFTATGTYVGQWGTAGSGNGQFTNPFSVAVDGAGNVYVSDYYNNRVQQFTANGTYRSQWGSAGSANGQFAGPTGVAATPSGSVYVVDGGNSRIQRFASTLLSLSVDQSQVSPGEGIDYHLTISNVTANTLTEVRVTDAHVPDCEGPVEDLAPGASVTVECTYNTTADDVGPFTNTASVDTDQTDTLTSNTVSTQVGSAVTVSMTAPTRVTATASIPYVIDITNNTSLTLSGVRVSDTAVPGCAGPVADIAAGATATVNCTKATTDADSGSSVFNAAFVDAPGTQGGFATAVTSVRGRITGTITGPNGPVAGAFVLALSRDFLPLQGDTVANASGVYNLGLDPGRYYVVFLDPSGATQAEYYNNRTSTAQLTPADLLTVNVGSGPATANASLAAGFLPVANPATISGTVTDANGPVAGVWVVAVNAGVRSAVRTNAAGQYTVGNLPAGNAYLEFADPAGTHAFRWYLNNDGTNPTAIPVTAGQHVTGINQVLPPYP